jgi:hypothetical protein
MNEQQPTVAQQRLINMLSLEGVHMAHMGYARWYMCHPNGPRVFVQQQVARSLVQEGYVALDDTTDDGREWYVLADRQGKGD